MTEQALIGLIHLEIKMLNSGQEKKKKKNSKQNTLLQLLKSGKNALNIYRKISTQ